MSQYLVINSVNNSCITPSTVKNKRKQKLMKFIAKERKKETKMLPTSFSVKQTLKYFSP